MATPPIVATAVTIASAATEFMTRRFLNTNVSQSSTTEHGSARRQFPHFGRTLQVACAEGAEHEHRAEVRDTSASPHHTVESDITQMRELLVTRNTGEPLSPRLT